MTKQCEFQAGSESRARFQVGKVRISSTTLEVVLSTLDDEVRREEKGYLCVANVRTCRISQSQPNYCRIQNDSLLTLPDGMPLIWIARCGGNKTADRVTGYSMMKALFSKGYSHYFFGDTIETLTRLKAELSFSYPRAVVAGSVSPPFRPYSQDEIRTYAHEMNQAAPDFIWIGLGAPKQEYFIQELLPFLDRGIVVGVGAAFRFFTGEYKQYNRIVQALGLEGLFWRLFRVRFKRLVLGYPPLIGFVVKHSLIQICQRVTKA